MDFNFPPVTMKKSYNYDGSYSGLLREKKGVFFKFQFHRFAPVHPVELVVPMDNAG